MGSQIRFTSARSRDINFLDTVCSLSLSSLSSYFNSERNS